MRALRLSLFICFSFLLLAAVAGVEPVHADTGVASSVAAIAVPAGGAGGSVAVESSALKEFLSDVPAWLQALSLLISAFAAIAALTPTPKDDGILLVLRKIVDFLALNFGGARNAGAAQNRSDFR